jgi:hypothetical protein
MSMTFLLQLDMTATSTPLKYLFIQANHEPMPLATCKFPIAESSRQRAVGAAWPQSRALRSEAKQRHQRRHFSWHLCPTRKPSAGPRGPLCHFPL